MGSSAVTSEHALTEGVRPGDRRRERIRRWFQTPIGVPSFVAIAALVLGTMWWFSYPTAGGMGMFALLAIGYEAFGAYYLVRLIGGLASCGHRDFLARWRRWFLPIGVVVVGGILVTFNAPFTARFATSRTSMEDFVRTTEPFHAPDSPRWVGLYRVDEFQDFEYGTRFRVVGAGFIDSGGFAYMPDGAPPDRRSSAHNYRHIEGPWYVWEWEF